jgi:hypothetical protein
MRLFSLGKGFITRAWICQHHHTVSLIFTFFAQRFEQIYEEVNNVIVQRHCGAGTYDERRVRKSKVEHIIVDSQ